MMTHIQKVRVKLLNEGAITQKEAEQLGICINTLRSIINRLRKEMDIITKVTTKKSKVIPFLPCWSWNIRVETDVRYYTI